MPDSEEQKMPDQKEVLVFFWEVVKVVAICLAIIIPVRYYLFQPFFVKGASMEPAFHDGDYVLIDELTYNFRDPQRGEIIIFRSPQDHSQFYIKRVIGLPGEQIKIKNGEVIVFNKQYPRGFVLDESEYLEAGLRTTGDLQSDVPKNEYFVLGDNRLHSSDSRYWGLVGRNLVTGRVLLRAWPLSKIAKFKEIEYSLPK